MDKIDRLGWAAGLSFKSYGVPVGIRVNNVELLDRVVEHLPPGWETSSTTIVERLYSIVAGGVGKRSNVRRFNLLYGNIARLARTVDLDQALEIFESDLQLHVAEAARRRVFVHAGVVGWRGQAIVIPGRSFSGKTTLVAELVRAGATYYSDEYAVLDARGRVHPYSKPLAIRDDATKKQKKYLVEALGGITGSKPLPVGLVVVSSYKQSARWRPRQVSAGKGALALLANTVSARRQPDVALSTLQQIVARAPILKGMRGEAKEMVESVLSYLGAKI
jgi:hypothetical protein